MRSGSLPTAGAGAVISAGVAVAAAAAAAGVPVVAAAAARVAIGSFLQPPGVPAASAKSLTSQTQCVAASLAPHSGRLQAAAALRAHISIRVLLLFAPSLLLLFNAAQPASPLLLYTAKSTAKGAASAAQPGGCTSTGPPCYKACCMQQQQIHFDLPQQHTQQLRSSATARGLRSWCCRLPQQQQFCEH
ncbi:hypothetical protein ACSSS7_000277 [Eimeria intestinalis]